MIDKQNTSRHLPLSELIDDCFRTPESHFVFVHLEMGTIAQESASVVESECKQTSMAAHLPDRKQNLGADVRDRLI